MTNKIKITISYILITTILINSAPTYIYAQEVELQEQATSKATTETTEEKLTGTAVQEQQTTNPQQEEEHYQITTTTNEQEEQGFTPKTIEATIDKSSGAAIFTYPLFTPEGHNGLSPQIFLKYDSRNQDYMSYVGYGWELNIPYITRINKYIN